MVGGTFVAGGKRIGLGILAATLLGIGPASAAQSIDIPVILPLTGNAAFLGQGERDSLVIQEGVVNKQGGINGSPVHYVIHDDQSSPQVAVQLANQVAATHPAIVLGSGLVAMCNAMMPVLADGPVLYCFSPAFHPPAGSNAFSAFISTHDEAIVMAHYFRDRGITKLGMITSADASGQDGVTDVTDALKLPENKNLKIVAATKFSPTDVSVSAQIEQLKAAGAQAIIAWTSGAPYGTVLKAIVQSGLDLPVVCSDANMTYAQMKQYAAFLPKETLFMSSVWPEHAGIKLDPAVEAAQKVMFDAYKAAGKQPDVTSPHGWDVANLVVAAYRKFGAQITPKQMHDFIATTKGWAGVNGIYDFNKIPQRGLDVGAIVMTRWQPDENTWTIISKPGGALP
jgi:branched-chain amino acid transport system substrate-binding protein